MAKNVKNQTAQKLIDEMGKILANLTDEQFDRFMKNLKEETITKPKNNGTKS